MEILVEAAALSSSPLEKHAPVSGQHPTTGRDRVVLDTNVCLDLFVFRDPRCAHLLEAMRAQRIEAVTRTDCRTEWQLVLRYPNLPLDDISRREAEQEFDALISCIETSSHTSTALPVCKDKDDQKFLEVARDVGASTLITKDKALLKLGRKAVRAGLFRIVLPQDWAPEDKQVPDAG